ncbi:hypothetical protein CAPTEDRAFT_224485 [Capitella teleta]|uniref:Tumor suppressor candidate 2 n=1 Tax=Capitella teleta TaxID=283909 RepID=R7T8A3_CAPTE|nr:hypothetical protein CAPTEDRAFT_224485 [Capitella teleta]|eukprot:ELT89909.1 hypothetical protein CAPTEDRAFT_224485 [Capitella teleta]
MGQTMKKMASPFMGWSGQSSGVNPNENQMVASPFIYTRQSSMFFDEEGDLAHEFYEEVPGQGSSKCTMRQCFNIIPQGEVELSHPRLHVDFPVVLCEAMR